MSGDQKRQLEQKLWNIADELRGKMHADEFRDYCLGFVFYKYLSEKQDFYATELLKGEAVEEYRTLTDPELLAAIHNESLEMLGYFLNPEQLFSSITQKGNSGYIIDELHEILTHIEQSTMGSESEEDFVGLFDELDLQARRLGSSPNARNELIVKILTHLNEIDFKLGDTKADVLGDAYEYLIGKFAAGAGKKAGEFYTPQQISTVLAKIVRRAKANYARCMIPPADRGRYFCASPKRRRWQSFMVRK